MGDCQIPGCVNKTNGSVPWCVAHEKRLARGWTMAETEYIPIRPRGPSRETRVALSLRGAGYVEAAQFVMKRFGPKRGNE